MNNLKIYLVVAAHPDDEVLGCGGTIARLSREGHKVFIAILGEGITSRSMKRNRGKKNKEIMELKVNIEKANKIIGVKETFTFDYPDNRFDTVPILDIIKTIEKVKNKIKPEVVFTHHHGDLNIDHRVTLQAVMTAFRPLENEKVNEIYSFEIPSSTEWNVPVSTKCFMPNFFVDISNTLKQKINAMKKYKSEIRDMPHPRSSKAIEIMAKKRGIEVGLEAAEAFFVVRIVK